MTYSPNIPQPGDIISISQGQILNNFQSNGSAFDVNHVDFNASGAGKHKFVEMPDQGSDPATASGETTLYSKSVSGISRLFLREESNGTTRQFSGPVSATTNGYTTLLGGVILQWGNAGPLGDGSTITFPVTFPNACFQVYVSLYNNSAATAANDFVSVRNSTISTTQFTITSSLRTVVGPSNSFFSWLAIGN